VNIVRNEAQVAILRDLGADIVLDSSKDDFAAQLQGAVAATGATCDGVGRSQGRPVQPLWIG
jgi:NADPH:quinone reductase-like Zn-dependent oxidoreductase